MRAIHSRLGVLAVLLLAVTHPGALPQVGSEAAQRSDAPGDAAIRAFRTEAGLSWNARLDRDTGFVRFLFGGRMEPVFRPVTDPECRTVAREFVRGTEPLHGIELSTLRDDRVVFLPLAAAFSTDKLTARFTQEVDGVPVRGGTVNVLMDTSGGLLSVDSNGLPRVAGFDVSPTISAANARRLAIELFRAETGVIPNAITEPRLVVEQERGEKGGRSPALGWELDLRFEERGFQHRGATYVMAASGAERRISAYELYHSFDVFGTVESLVSPGLLPDSAANPPVALPMAHMDIQTPLGTFTTDASGNFDIPGVNTTVDATFRFEGLYANADDSGAVDYELQLTLQPNVQNDVLMNSPATEFVTAQANAYREISALRDWLVSVNPADPILDFQADALVNQTWKTCNATFDGAKTNYFVETVGQCTNSAYSTIIYHEMGHFLNQLYGSGNGSDGFGEGAADIWAQFMSDDPVVGDEFKGAGTFIRTGTNTNPFCGDDGQGCYGATHADGQPLMGAFWKWRENYNATYGDAAGDLAADVLLNAWFNAYDDGQVLSIVEEHLLVLDDDDANIANGTPNYDDIDGGFLAQGWPGYERTFVNFANETHPVSTRDEHGPYGVAMELTSAMGGAISSATAFYRVDGGTFATVPMPFLAADIHTALLPGQTGPALVEYYVDVQDTLGNTQTLPRNAPNELFSFRVGVDTVYWSDSFDGPDDNGWTHVQTATQDDWQRDTPTGQVGISGNVSWQDPPAAASPPFCWGNDLGLSGFNGSHQANVDNSLFSPVIDLTGAANTVLAFKRWLNVERGVFDQSQIYVNGNLVWENPQNQHILDTGWTDFEVDISAFADNNAATQIEFRLVSDGGLELGGWSLDDVAIVSHDPVPQGCLFTTYGTGLAGVLGIPTIDTGGQPLRIGNSDFVLQMKNGKPVSGMWLFAGIAQQAVPALGGTFLVDPSWTWLKFVNKFGQARQAIAIQNDPLLVGFDIFVQGFVADASLPEEFSITPGIMMTICN